MNSVMSEQILERNPSLRGREEALSLLSEGSYCIHRSWGFGKIKGYDAAQNRLVVDFLEADKHNHPMDPVFCVEKLELLPKGSILVRQQDEPERISALIKNDPAALVREIINDTPDLEISTQELERILARLVGEVKFKRWWTQARRELLRDPAIEVPARRTESFVLREKPIHREEEVLKAFYATKRPYKKILLAEELLSLCESAKNIENELPQALEALSTILSDRTTHVLTPAQRLHGVWIRNDLARHLSQDVDTLEPKSTAIIQERDLNEIAKELPSNYYGRFLKLVTRVYPEQYSIHILELLRSSSGKFTNECVQLLVENGLQEDLVVALKRWLEERSIKAPIINWAIKNRQSRKFAPIVGPIMVPSLLNAAFYAIDEEVHQATGNSRIQLADTISEDPEIVQELLSLANTETARDLAHSLMMKQGFNDLTKRSILARFIRLFPSVQQLISGGEEPVSTEHPLIVSAASMERKKKEYEHLINVEIPNNKEAIATAREHGDLKENSEYKMAREDHTTLMARKAQMERDLGNAVVKDFSKVPTDVVAIGSRVTLRAKDSGAQHVFSVLGAWDSDPEKNALSYKTPIAQALLNKRVGETVTLDITGSKEVWEVVELGAAVG